MLLYYLVSFKAKLRIESSHTNVLHCRIDWLFFLWDCTAVISFIRRLFIIQLINYLIDFWVVDLMHLLLNGNEILEQKLN